MASFFGSKLSLLAKFAWNSYSHIKTYYGVEKVCYHVYKVGPRPSDPYFWTSILKLLS